MIFIICSDNIDGFKNEIEICNELNNKKIYELNPMYRAFIEDLYKNVNENDILKCMVDHTKRKYDIIIEKNKIKKKISIKKGIKIQCMLKEYPVLYISLLKIILAGIQLLNT